MSVDLGGEFDIGKIGFGADYTESETVSYQLRMTNEDYARMESGENPAPSHHDPDTMPVGSAIVMTSTDAQETGFSASYDVLKGTAGVSEEESASVAVEKTDEDTVRVTVGPSEQIENSFQLGLEFGPASVHVGNTTSLESGRLTTVEFDLSTDEGQTAYNTFVATGELPTESGTGVSGQTVVETLDYDSTSTAGGALGPLEGSVELGSSNLSIVQTTYPDGS